MTSIMYNPKIQHSQILGLQPSKPIIYMRQGQCQRNRRGKINCAVRGKTRRCEYAAKAQKIENAFIRGAT